jgi:hypothetical protein
MVPLTIVVPEPEHVPDEVGRLLARSSIQNLPWDLEQVLLRFFALEASSAPFYALHEGLQAQEGFWLCLKLATISPVRDYLYVEEAALSPAESQQMETLLNPFFAEVGFKLYMGQACNLLQSDKPLICDAISFEAIRNGYLLGAPFQGADRAFFARLLTEAQMLLATHPMNLQREEEGKQPVNSIWLWGGGHWQTPKPVYQRIFGHHPLLLGLAKASGMEVLPTWQLHDLQEQNLLVTKDYEQVMDALPRLAAKMPASLVFVRGAQSTFFALSPRQRFFFWRKKAWQPLLTRAQGFY